MSVLLNLYPGDRVVECMVVASVAVVLVSAAGWMASWLFKRHSALRHSLLLIALLCSLVSPLLAAVFVATDASLLTLPLLFSEHTASAVPVTGLVEDTFRSGEYSAAGHVYKLSDSLPTLDQSGDLQQVGRDEVAMKPLRLTHVKATVSLVVVIWAGGAVYLSVGLLCSLLRLHKLRRSCRPVSSEHLEDALNEARRRLRREHSPTIFRSAELRTPVAIGLFRPMIVLPEDFLTAFNRSVVCDVLVHEIAHIMRHDHFVLLLQALARTVFWPIVFIHLLNRELARSREEVCDNYVLAHRDAVGYGEELLRLAELVHGRTRIALSIGIFYWRGSLEERITRLIDTRRNKMVRTNRIAAIAILAFFALGSAIICSTTVVSAQTDQFDTEDAPEVEASNERAGGEDDAAEETDDGLRSQAEQDAPIIAENFFIAPVTTELQKRKLGPLAADNSLVKGKDYVAYLKVHASAFIVPGLGLNDPSGEFLDPIRRSLKSIAQRPDQGRLRVNIAYGPHTVDRHASLMIRDIFRGMAHEAGFTGADVYGSRFGRSDNKAVHEWRTLPLDVEERPQDERKFKAGSACLYPVTTALTRYLTNNTDLYIDIEAIKSVQAKGIFSADEIPIVQKAIEQLGLKRKERVHLSVALEEPKQPYDVYDLSQVRQDSDFHTAAVKLLKSAGFKEIRLSVRVGASNVVSAY